MTEAERKPAVGSVLIAGVGLMGGSFGLALRARGLAERVVGFDPDPAALESAIVRGAIDTAATDLREAAANADLIVLSAPVRAITGLLQQSAPAVADGALVTDFGSTKAAIVAVGERLLGGRFVGGHPMAGSEEGGMAAARATLFEGAAWAIMSGAPNANVPRLESIVRAVGGRPILIDAVTHDRIVALVSHLPHLLSFAFAATVDRDPQAALARSMAGGSFRDLTRVSMADPTMWRDIMRENRQPILEALEAYEHQLAFLRECLVEEEDDALLRALKEAGSAGAALIYPCP